MLYFTLPYFHQFDNKLPNILFKLSIEQEDKFITPVHFFSKYDNFPYCYLCGGFNTNNGTFYRYHQLESNANYKNGGVKRLNLSNINFNEFDINDEYLNTILTLYNTGSNFIDIPNEQIGQAILNKGYIYDLIIKLINDDLDIQVINSLTSLDYINLVSLPMGFTTNLDFIRSLANRNKIELTVNSICHKCNKINQKLCLSEEHQLMYNYSNYSYIQDCINKDNYKNSLVERCYREEKLVADKFTLLLKAFIKRLITDIYYDKNIYDRYVIEIPEEVLEDKKDLEKIIELVNNPLVKRFLVFGVSNDNYNKCKNLLRTNKFMVACMQDFKYINEIDNKLTNLDNGDYDYIVALDYKDKDMPIFKKATYVNVKELLFNKE